jgi:hypothetical protein
MLRQIKALREKISCDFHKENPENYKLVTVGTDPAI